MMCLKKMAEDYKARSEPFRKCDLVASSNKTCQSESCETMASVAWPAGLKHFNTAVEVRELADAHVLVHLASWTFEVSHGTAYREYVKLVHVRVRIEPMQAGFWNSSRHSLFKHGSSER